MYDLFLNWNNVHERNPSLAFIGSMFDLMTALIERRRPIGAVDSEALLIFQAGLPDLVAMVTNGLDADYSK